MTEGEVSLRLRKMKIGFQLWKKLVEIHNLKEKDYVIAFPHQKNPVNEYGVKYLGQFMEYTKAEKILILCVGDYVAKLIGCQADREKIAIEILKSEDMKSIVTCYSIVNLSQHFIMMSLTEPFGRYGDKVLQRNGMKLDEIISYGIYGMPKFVMKG